MGKRHSHDIKIDYQAYPLVVHKPFRRQNQRFKLYAPARLSVDGGEEEEIILKDVSARGIRLTTTQPLQVHSSVRIDIDKPVVEKPVTIQSQVVWCTTKDKNLYEAGLTADTIDLDNFKEKMLAHAEIGITTSGGTFRKKFDLDIFGLILALAFVAAAVFGALRIPGVRDDIDKRMLAMRKALGYHMEGVIYDPEGTSVVSINDKIVEEGETFKNLKVEKINEHSVVVSLGERKKVVTFSSEQSE